MTVETQTATLHKHAQRGWLWGGLDQFAQRGLTMVVSLVLARLLDPAAFGLIAAVSIFFGIAGQLIDGGVAQRVVQKPDVQEEDYCALFWCNGVISFLCSGALICFSGVIARFYNEPQLRLIVIALAVNIFLMNAGRVQETWLIRHFRFRAFSVIQIASVLVGCVVGLVMAFSGCGVWSILGQQLSTAIVRAASLWIVVPWHPSAWPMFSAVKDLYGYGLPVVFSQTVRTLASQLINVLIAKVGSLHVLGFYDRGNIIPQNAGYSLSNIFSRTNFPVLAKLQNDETAFRETYIKFLQITSAAYFILMAGLAVCAQDIIRILMGEKWLPSVWFLQANCAAFSFYVIFTGNADLLKAKGRMMTFFRYNMLGAGMQIVGVLSGMPWGAKGMVVGSIFAQGLSCIPLAVAVSRNSLVTVRDQLRALCRPFAGAAAVGAGLLSIRLIGLPLYPRFILSGMVGAGVILLYWRTDGFKDTRLLHVSKKRR